jgi:Icc-related predicted phosphoesterase
MITAAAVGDVHLGEDAAGRLRPHLRSLPERADLLLLAGDLSRHGTVDEARVVAGEFGGLELPVVAVLGNHDYHSNAQDEITRVLSDAGIQVLEGEGVVLNLHGCRVGVAGVKGFGGGFAGKCGSNFGEPEMKAFISHTVATADRLHAALGSLDCDLKIALTHYSPVPQTLRGEPPEIYPFLGCYQLAEAIDANHADLAVHGHAHFGRERGVTPGGVRVRNVAQPVINAAYACYQLEPARIPSH